MKKLFALVFLLMFVLCSCSSGEKKYTLEEAESILRAQETTTIEKQTTTQEQQTTEYTTPWKRNTRSSYQSTSSSQPRTTEAYYDYDYVANKNTKKFHVPTCASVGDMAEKNKWYYTGSRQDLIDMGYDPCQRCYP